MPVIGADRQLRLRPGRRFQGAQTEPPAIRTSAIPLRKSAAGGASKYSDPHGAYLDLSVGVNVRFSQLRQISSNSGAVHFIEWFPLYPSITTVVVSLVDGSRKPLVFGKRGRW